MKKVLLVVVVAGIGYLMHVYWSVAENYMAIRYSAQKLANQTERDGRVDHGQITQMRHEVARETGIELYGADINVRNVSDGAEVEVETRLKAHFPLLDREVVHEVEITAKARDR